MEEGYHFAKSTSPIGYNARMIKHILTLILLLGSSTAAFAEETPEAFLQRYYTALHGAKSLKDLDPYCTPMPESEKAKMAEVANNPFLMQLAMQMMKNEPKGFKVVTKKQEGDKVFLQLAPNPVPAEFAAQSKSPGFSMKGEAILVADGKGSWKVHKDFWTVEEKSKDGSSKTTFGRNPDNSKKSADSAPPAPPADEATQSSPQTP